MGRTKEQRELAAAGLRECIVCGEIKSRDRFSVKRHYYDNNGNRKYTTLDSRCKDCVREYNYRRKISSPRVYCRSLAIQVKHRAKVVGVPFDVTGDDLLSLWEVQDGRCLYTGALLDLSHRTLTQKSPHRLFPSLDRQVPKLGYVVGNLAWCIYSVNRMKSDLTHDEFVDFCHAVSGRFELPIPA